MMPGKAPISRHKVFAVKINTRRRTELANKDDALKSAKAATTKAINRGLLPDEYFTPTTEQAAFKKGVIAMGDRMGTEAQAAKIRNMDANKLDALYKSNKFVFDVYFSYESVTASNGSVSRSEVNIKNTAFLIEQYERAFGAL